VRYAVSEKNGRSKGWREEDELVERGRAIGK
jgi:hypothetical protein